MAEKMFFNFKNDSYEPELEPYEIMVISPMKLHGGPHRIDSDRILFLTVTTLSGTLSQL